MGDVVLQLPVETNEDMLFGAYVNRFIESRAYEVERFSVSSDAPYLMIRQDPALGDQVRILIFQESDTASDFSSGWAEARVQRPAP